MTRAQEAVDVDFLAALSLPPCRHQGTQVPALATEP